MDIFTGPGLAPISSHVM